jgi:hypothetical protein
MFMAILEELVKLNRQIIINSNLADTFKLSNSFLYGFNPHGRTEDPDSYKKHASFTNAITEVLKEFDISIKNNGYAYIVDAVKLIIDQNRLDLKMSDDVYPHIRCKYKLKNIAIVEHNIRNAIKSAYNRCHELGLSNRMRHFTKKPSNKKFLLMLSDEVRSRMCKDYLEPLS